MSMTMSTCVLVAATWLGAEVPVNVPNDEAKPAAEGLFEAPRRLEAEDGPIDSGESWGHSGPWVEDVDADGLRDLVVGDFSGFFRLYRNHGSNDKPRYAAAVNLKAGGEDAKVPIY